MQPKLKLTTCQRRLIRMATRRQLNYRCLMVCHASFASMSKTYIMTMTDSGASLSCQSFPTIRIKLDYVPPRFTPTLRVLCTYPVCVHVNILGLTNPLVESL